MRLDRLKLGCTVLSAFLFALLFSFNIHLSISTGASTISASGDSNSSNIQGKDRTRQSRITTSDIQPKPPDFTLFGRSPNFLIHATKCGGTSFFFMASRAAHGCVVRYNHAVRHFLFDHTRWLLNMENDTCYLYESERIAPRGLCQSEFFDEYGVVLVIRDPFERVYSDYRMRLGYNFPRNEITGELTFPPGCEFEVISNVVLDLLAFKEGRERQIKFNKIIECEKVCPSENMCSAMNTMFEKMYFHNLIGRRSNPYTKLAFDDVRSCINRFALILDIRFDYGLTLALANHFLRSNSSTYAKGRLSGFSNQAQQLFPEVFKRFYKRHRADFDLVEFARNRFYSDLARESLKKDAISLSSSSINLLNNKLQIDDNLQSEIVPKPPDFTLFGKSPIYLMHATKCGGTSFFLMASAASRGCVIRHNQIARHFLSSRSRWLIDMKNTSCFLYESERFSPRCLCDSNFFEEYAVALVIRDPFERVYSEYRMRLGYNFPNHQTIPPGCEFSLVANNLFDKIALEEGRIKKMRSQNFTACETLCPSENLCESVKKILKLSYFHIMLGRGVEPYSKHASNRVKQCLNRFALILDIQFDYSMTLGLVNHFLKSKNAHYAKGRVSGSSELARNLFPEIFTRFHKRHRAEFDLVDFARSRFYSELARKGLRNDIRANSKIGG